MHLRIEPRRADRPQQYTVTMNLSLSQSELPVRLRFDRPVTDEEFMRFCAANEPMRFEMEPDGEITVMSPSGSEGGGLELEVGIDLGIWARMDGRGRVFGPNAGFKLPDGSVRAADAAWVSWNRWNALTREEQQGFAPLCPEFVIEVRSNSDRLPPLQAKMEQWIANGAEVAWMIDPSQRSVTIYRHGDSPETFTSPTSVQGTGPVSGFELVLSRVWD